MSCASIPGSSKRPGVTARTRTARRASGFSAVSVTAATLVLPLSLARPTVRSAS